MQWWTWLWLVSIAWLTIGGAWDDHLEHRRIPAILLSILSGLTCIVLVLAFTLESLAAAVGPWLLPLSLLAGLQLSTDAVRDLRSLSPDPELTAREHRAIEAVGIAVFVLVFGSAIAAGILTGFLQA